MTNALDITPTPRILRTLGDIPFDVWQCVAELSDNSLDAFQEEEGAGRPVDGARLDIHWSSETTPLLDRELIVEDNGPGMTLEQLQNAARAGYSNNDPIHNLGLFGMGFNIATARLGDETLFVSMTKESGKWVGIRINFAELVKNQSFSAPIVSFPKKSGDECGTRVIVRNFKDGVFSDLRRKESSIRSRLEFVYSPILEREKVDIYLQGKRLRPRPHCVWGETRFVVRKGERVHAIQRVDRDLGETWFDLSRNRYLSEDEAADYDVKESKGEAIPSGIVKRSRRLKGWIGVQRYSDTSDFGVDFIRNGRKILVADKSIFGFENPDTGTFVSEYPVELGTTVGGRIVGELNVDYLIPTYQKNGFDTTDRAWRVTIEAIRGAGPILPKKRKAFGYDEDNTSPLGKLVNAYRRADPGTKNLSLPSSVAREFLKEYQGNNPEYQTDDKWYRAAQEADREKGVPSTPVDKGVRPTDDPGEYGPATGATSTAGGAVQNENASATASSQPQNQPVLTSKRDDLIKKSEKVDGLCGKYLYDATVPGFVVTGWRASGAHIKNDGARVPFISFQDGPEMDFFFDESHPLLAEYPITPRQLLLQALAEKFSVRDSGLSMHKAFFGLVENHLTDERVNLEILKERAQFILNNIRDGLPQLLAHRTGKAMEVVGEVAAEQEALANNLLDEAPHLLEAYQSGGEDARQALAYVPTETVIRLVERIPEEFMDGKVFTLPYSGIELGDEETKARLRRTVLDKVVTYLKDTKTLLRGGGAKPTKSELIRYANTLAILEDRLA